MGRREATEEVRDVAAEILSDLRVTPAGFRLSDFPCRKRKGDGASSATVHRAIAHLREHGVAIEHDRSSQRWRLGNGRRHLPAVGLSREDLLDELRAAFGDRDPLEAIRAERLERAANEWRTVDRWPTIVLAKSKHAISWIASYYRHKLEITAAPALPGGRVDVSRTRLVCEFPEFDIAESEIRPFADWQIARHWQDVAAGFADASEGKAAASW